MFTSVPPQTNTGRNIPAQADINRTSTAYFFTACDLYLFYPPAAAHPHTALHCSAARTTPAPASYPASPATADNARPAVPLPVLHPTARSVPGCVAMYVVTRAATAPTTAPAATSPIAGPPAPSAARAASCPA